ncbi:hypothetical protein MOXK02_19100 [Moraxella sp. K02]
MSFLNPISEPVLMYSSTDDQAPKINYAARAAGDIKTVLKACLVTGYGTKQGAGWSIQNETDFAAEFISPSVAMSDYSFGVTDTSTAQTTWYYNFKGVKTTPAKNNPAKSFYYINASHADNGWRMLITQRGFLFVELVQHPAIGKLSARLTYFGAIKSGITDTGGINIAFINTGHSGLTADQNFYTRYDYLHIKLESYSNIRFCTALPRLVSSLNNSSAPSRYDTSISIMDLHSVFYLVTSGGNILLGELPGLIGKMVNDKTKMFGVSEEVFNGRPVLRVCCGFPDTVAENVYLYSQVMLLPLDYWEY